jgi:hypothetical protein
MVVVETFSPSCIGNPGILSGFDFLVVRSVAPHVSCGVDKPCTVKTDDVTTERSNNPRVEPRVADKTSTNNRRKKKTKEYVKEGIEFSLEVNDWVIEKVREI